MQEAAIEELQKKVNQLTAENTRLQSLSAEQQLKLDTLHETMARQDGVHREIVEEIIDRTAVKMVANEVARDSVALSWYSKAWLRVAKLFGSK